MDTLPLSGERRVDAVCLRFEEALRTGPSPRVEDYLGDTPEPERSALLCQLQRLEQEYRRTPQVPGYEVLGELGRGGMGIVYKARDLSLNRVVALKMLRDADVVGPEQMQRFRREAENVARLDHPHIVPVYEVGEHQGRPFFTMKWLPGRSLAEQVAGGPLPPRQAAEVVAVVARAVHYAHQNDVIHRDLKPANILLAPASGRDSESRPPAGIHWVPFVTDFGLSKYLGGVEQTHSGAVLGTPAYMAPEQAAGRSRDISARTDVYGLGALLYALLTGRPPFQAPTTLETLDQVVREAPARPRLLNPRIDRDLETICLACLEKDPSRRYATAADLAADLERYLAGQPIKFRPSLWVVSIVTQGERAAPATWGPISLWFGLIGGVNQFGIFALLLLGWSAAAFAWWMVLTHGTGWLVLWNYVACRADRLARDERHLLAITVGGGSASFALWLVAGAPVTAEGMSAVYPAWCVVLGVISFVQGSIYWGWFYLVALAWFGLAFLTRHSGVWAPVELGLLYGASHGLIGLYLLSRARKEAGQP